MAEGARLFDVTQGHEEGHVLDPDEGAVARGQHQGLKLGDARRRGFALRGEQNATVFHITVQQSGCQEMAMRSMFEKYIPQVHSL